MHFITTLFFALPLLARASAGDFAHQQRDAVTHVHHRTLKARLSEETVLSVDRVRRGQVDTRALRKSPSKIRVKRNNPSPTPIVTPPATCLYAGSNLATKICDPTNGGSDGCNEPNLYKVTGEALIMLGGNTFQSGGHVNFAFIPYADYKGTGSYSNAPSNWHVSQGHIDFDPNNGQPGGQFIGKTSYPFDFGGILPTTGYCIVWVQVSNFNVHFGENGAGPVCVCPQ